MSNARQPASQPTPQNPAASPQPSSHSTLRIDPNDVTTTSTSSVLPSDSRARRTCPAASPSNASTETPVRRSTPAARCISAAIAPITPPSAPDNGAGPRSVTVTSRPSSRHTEATSEPMNPEPMISTRRGPGGQSRLQPRGVGTGAHGMDALQRGFLRVGPSPGPHTGGDQQPIARDLAAVSQPHQPVGAVQGGRGHTESPLGIHLAQPRQLGVIGGHPALEDLFGQRRAVVGLVGLVADDRELPAKTLFPQRFGGTKPGQRSADNDDAAVVFEAIPGSSAPARYSVSSRSTMIACTGHDAAARNTRKR